MFVDKNHYNDELSEIDIVGLDESYSLAGGHETTTTRRRGRICLRGTIRCSRSSDLA